MNDAIKRAIQLRLSLAKTPVKKYEAFRARTVAGRAHGMLLYHGASTGRWSSTGINVQNLPRPSFSDTDTCIELFAYRDPEIIDMLYDDTMEALSSCLRGMITAPEGKRLLAADYSAIEARVLAWLAGQEDVLAVFRGHGKLYEHTAAQIYRIPIEQISKDQRQIGKVAALALGYQGAVGAFQSMAGNYGLKVPDEQAEQIKDDWRAANKHIVKFWRKLDDAAIEAVRSNQQCSVGNKGIAFKVSGGFLYCRLPSGRLLAYCQPKIAEGTFGNDQVSYMGVDPLTRKWCRQYIYGGKWAENITQAVARDLMAAAMLRVEAAGYEVVLSVHDELLAEAPEGHGSLQEFEALMCELPPWAGGLPIAAAGFEAKRYRKD